MADRRHPLVPETIGQIPEMFGSIKTAMMEYFDDRYATLAEAAVAGATMVVAAARVGDIWAF